MLSKTEIQEYKKLLTGNLDSAVQNLAEMCIVCAAVSDKVKTKVSISSYKNWLLKGPLSKEFHSFYKKIIGKLYQESDDIQPQVRKEKLFTQLGL